MHSRRRASEQLCHCLATASQSLGKSVVRNCTVDALRRLAHFSGLIPNYDAPIRVLCNWSLCCINPTIF